MNLTASLIAQLVVFFILIWFTAKVVWPPLKKALDDYRARIATALAAAERGKSDMVDASRHAQSIMAAAHEEARKLLGDYERLAQNIVDEAGRVADAEARRIVATAHVEADQMLHRMRAQLRAQVAEIAVVGAANILAKEIDANENARLLVQLKGELKE